MYKRKINNSIAAFKPSANPEGFLFALVVFLIVFINSIIVYAEQPSASVKTYRIESIAFDGYQIVSGISKIPIIFCTYGERTKVVYPAPKENVLKDSSLISEKCFEAISQNVDKIVETQLQIQSVRKYLTVAGRIAPLTKDDFLNIVSHPQECTFQRDLSIDKHIAEFRSKEIMLDGNGAFCVYITFICDSKDESVEEVLISAVNLESKG